MEVVKKDENWRDYVNTETVVLIEDLFKYQNLTIVAKIHNMKYISLRSKYLTACKRIKNKSKDYMRNGKSEKAQKLFGLINKLPDWKKGLTDTEILYTEKFLKLKNFHAVGKELNSAPSNIAGTIYGTTQRSGVMEKLEKNYKNTEYLS